MSRAIDAARAAEAVLTNGVVERHSLFQLQCFVLAKEPTIQGKLQQCLKEIKSRKQSLDALELEIEEQHDNVKLIDLDADALGDAGTDADQIRKEIALRRLARRKRAAVAHVATLKKKQDDLSDETLFFCTAFDQLNRQEKLKPWDDPEVQKQYWSEKLRFELNTRLMLRQLPDVELLKTILCLHDDAPIKVKCLEMLRKTSDEQAKIQQKN